jgi:diacylglycerol kinase (ATP)
MKHARLIMNPISGTDEPNPLKLPDIIAALEAEDIRADLAFTKPDESPALIAQQAVDEGYELVIVSGGDGTVSEVAKGLLHAPIPLGILPIGTFNNIARSLNLPLDLTAACQVLGRGQIKRIDVGQAIAVEPTQATQPMTTEMPTELIDVGAKTEDYFFEAAGVGLDAALFPLGEDIKGGRWGRMLQAFQLAMTYRPQSFKLQFDRPIAEARYPPFPRRFRKRKLITRNELQIKALLVVVANAPYYGAGFMVAPTAVIDDGMLTVTIYRKFSKWELLRHFWSISRGQYHYNPKIETYQVASVRLSSTLKLPVHTDGHPFGAVPVSFRIVREALNVMVPSSDTPAYRPQEDPNPPIALPVESVDAEVD